MKKWQKKYVVSVIILLFLGPIVGLIIPSSPNPQVMQPIAQNSVHTSWTVTSKSDLEWLSNQTWNGGDISVAGNISDATLTNFYLISPQHFVVEAGYTIDFAMRNVTLDTDLVIGGSPTIAGETVSIGTNFESFNYTNEPIGAPILELNRVNASIMRFRVSGGTFIWNNSQTSALTLNGFTTALLSSDTITGDLTVEGSGIVTILNTQIQGDILEQVDPTITTDQDTYNVPFAFVFQPRVQVDVQWSAVDNIRGPGYEVVCNLTIWKNGEFQQRIENIPTNSYQLSVDTAASSYEMQISCKDTQGNLSTKTISIVPQPNLLWFILMVVIIAAAAVGSIVVFYLRKQRQWQKTALVEIPA